MNRCIISQRKQTMKVIKKIVFTTILILPFVIACKSEVDELDGNIDIMLIAHRGAWLEYGLKENSVEAMLKADEIKVYGSEIDVWFTKDWIGVVNHDEKIGEMTIHEHTFDEIKAAHPQILKLEHMLDKFKTTKHIKLIVEVKPMSEKDKNHKCAELTTQMIQERNLSNRIEYITFSPSTGKRLIELNPHVKVLYLSSNKEPEDLKKEGYAGFNYYHPHILNNRLWIKKARTKGIHAGAWTINRQNDVKELVRHGIDYITTDRPREIKQMLLKERKRN